MENQSSEFSEEATTDGHPHAALINTFCEITACASKSEALFFLESHNFDLDAAVSTFLDDANPALADDALPAANLDSPPAQSNSQYSPSESLSANLDSPPAQSNSQYSPSESLSASPRSRSPSPPPASRPYRLRSGKPRGGASASGGAKRGGGGIRTLADLNRNPKDGDSDSDPDFDPQEYYTGGEKSGMLVQGPPKARDVDSIFERARRAGTAEPAEQHLPSSSSRSFAGTGRLLSGEVSSAPTSRQPETVNHTVTFWRNGFTVDDGPLRRLDDPANASFLESIENSECPKELAPADKRTTVHCNLIRRVGEDYKEPRRSPFLFQGVGRTLGFTSDAAPTEPNTVPVVLTAAPAPAPGLVVDQAQPRTSIQLRLADGTRMVSRFNNSHTIRDIRGFIDASRPGGPRNYQLQTMGFPPTQLADLDQTIDEAGIANSVVIQKL